MNRGDGARSLGRGRWRARARRAFVAVIVSLLAATMSTSAGAAPESATAPEQAKRRLVSVKIAGDPKAAAAVIDVLRERDGGGDVETAFEVVPAIDRASVVTPGPRNDQQLARIWIDLAEPSEPSNEPAAVTLYVVDGPWERVLVRPVVRHANPEITWEEIGHIVELALGALRAGESIGVDRDVAQAQLLPQPPPAPPPSGEAPPPAVVPPPVVERGWKLRGGGFYSATAYGSGLQLASGLGAIFEGHARRTGRLEYGVTLTAEYRFPSTVDRGAAMVRFDGGAFHAMASAAYVPSERHQLVLGAGGGLELVHARASSELDNLRFLDRGLDPIPTLRALARYVHSTSSLRLFAGLGVDVPLRNPRYLLAREGTPVVLFEPWLVRPFLMIGLETN